MEDPSLAGRKSVFAYISRQTGYSGLSVVAYKAYQLAESLKKKNKSSVAYMINMVSRIIGCDQLSAAQL